MLDGMDTNHRDSLRSSTRIFLFWCVPSVSSFLKHVCSRSQSDKKVTWLLEENLLPVQNTTSPASKALLHPALKCIQGTLEMKTSRGLLLVKSN